MKLLSAILGSLLISIVALGAEPDIHSKEEFMPPFEDWYVMDTGELVTPRDPNKKSVGSEEVVPRNTDGRLGFIEKVEEVVIGKIVDVELCSHMNEGPENPCHVHAAILLENGGWAMGEYYTFYSHTTNNNFSFCLVDYFTKKESCGVVAIIEEGPDAMVVRLKK